MARKFTELLEKMTPERRARVEKRALEMLEALPLYKIRQARGMTQTQLAEQIGSSQSEVSQTERRGNLYLTTLRRFVEAMGGEIEIIARFPEGAVRVTFDEFEEIATHEKRSA